MIFKTLHVDVFLISVATIVTWRWEDVAGDVEGLGVAEAEVVAGALTATITTVLELVIP